MNSFSLRKTTSLTALLSGAALAFSSICTYLAPKGSGSSQWGALGLNKHDWHALHTNLGILFLATCVLHIILNIKPTLAYLRNKEKKLRVVTLNFNIALLLTAWITLSSLFQLPPVRYIQDYKSSRHTNRHHQKPRVEEPEPILLPEKMPFLLGRRALSGICDEYQLDQIAMLDAMQDIGITAEIRWSIERIAEENDMEVGAVYNTVRQLAEQSD